MKYLLNVYTISECGQRPNQEDSIYPMTGSQNDADRLFLVCDGMGGHEHGEVASQAVCHALSRSILLSENQQEGAFTDSMLLSAINEAYDALNRMQPTVGEGLMGTTLALLKLHSEGATIAHIGDSRVYHIRPGRDAAQTRIMFRTTDHSDGSNAISRAMIPTLQERVMPDVHHIVDIQPGDYFYLCSDGMLERMDDSAIRFNFSHITGSDANKADIMLRATSENQDNHSAVIVHVVDVFASSPSGMQASSPEVSGKRTAAFWYSLVAVILAVVAVCIFLWPSRKEQPSADSPVVVTQPEASPRQNATSGKTHSSSGHAASTQRKPSKQNRREPSHTQAATTQSGNSQQSTGAAIVGAVAGQGNSNGRTLQQAVGNAPDNRQGHSDAADESPAESDQNQIGSFLNKRKKK